MSMTKLEAINRLLDAIGEDPVMSLASGLDDAESAERVLDRTSKEVQEQGWHVNTDENMRLLPDVRGYIKLSNSILKIDTAGPSRRIDVVRRNGKLFNKTESTFKFTSPVYVSIVQYLNFEDLTFDLQNYISALAAQRFQESTLGSTSVDGFTSRQVKAAWEALMLSEAENDDRNILSDNAFSARISGLYQGNYR